MKKLQNTHKARVESIKNEGVDYESRTVYLFGDVTEERAAVLCPALQVLDGPEPITLQIFSGGGQATVGLAIYDCVRAMTAPVTTMGFGEVMSAAALIFQAGDRRVLRPNTSLLFHDVYGFHQGDQRLTVADATRARREIVSLGKRCRDILQARSGLSAAAVKRICAAEREMWPEEAVRLGLADEVIS